MFETNSKQLVSQKYENHRGFSFFSGIIGFKEAMWSLGLKLPVVSVILERQLEVEKVLEEHAAVVRSAKSALESAHISHNSGADTYVGGCGSNNSDGGRSHNYSQTPRMC